MIEGRDSKGHFIKGNVPWNKRQDSTLDEQMTVSVCAQCNKPWGAPNSPARCPYCGQASFAIAVWVHKQKKVLIKAATEI